MASEPFRSVVLCLPGWGSFRTLADDTLDIHEASLREGDPTAELALLRTRGFRRGLARTWADPEHRVVDLTVLQFGEPLQAALYVADGREALRAQRAEIVRHENGFSTTTTDGSFRAHVRSMAWDCWCVVVVVEEGAGDASASASDDCAVAQVRAIRRWRAGTSDENSSC